MRRLALGVFCLVIAGTLIAYPLLPNSTVHEKQFANEVEEVQKEDIPKDANITNYSSLSSGGRNAFQKARRSDHTIHGVENKPSDFCYNDNTELGCGLYYIEEKGSYYQLTTYNKGNIFPIDGILRAGAVILGLLIGVIGYKSYKSHNERTLLLGSGLALFILIGIIADLNRISLTGFDSDLLIMTIYGGIVVSIAALLKTISI